MPPPKNSQEIISGRALKRRVLPEEVSYPAASLVSREGDAVTGRNISPIAVRRSSGSRRYSGALPPCILHEDLNFFRALPCSPLAFA
jgi:hypothetical protein